MVKRNNTHTQTKNTFLGAYKKETQQTNNIIKKGKYNETKKKKTEKKIPVK